MGDKAQISNGPNERARNETIAGTGPGIPDDARRPDKKMPEAPSDEDGQPHRSLANESRSPHC